MPPEVPKSLSRATNAQIQTDVSAGEEAILSFFDLEGAGLAIASTNFSLKEEMETLVRHIRDTDPAVSLRAQSQYRKTLNDMLEKNGRILSARQIVSSVDAEGRVIQQSAKSSRLISSLSQENKDARSRSAGQSLPYGSDFLPPDSEFSVRPSGESEDDDEGDENEREGETSD